MVLSLCFLYFLSLSVFSLERGKIYDGVLPFTKELLESSTLSSSAKKEFYEGVTKGIEALIDKVEGKGLEEEALVDSLRAIVRSSLLWRLSGREVKGFIFGFGDILKLGFSLEGSTEIVKRLILKEVSLSGFSEVIRLSEIAIRKYNYEPSVLEIKLREKLSMLMTERRDKLLKGLLEFLRGEIKEAKTKK